MVSAPNEQANEGHCPDMPTGEEGKKAAAGEFDSEEIIANRKGEVLLKHTVLKADHFPSRKQEVFVLDWEIRAAAESKAPY
eukprot:1138848-Pelagomonas_calceolata.AAC.1